MPYTHPLQTLTRNIHASTRLKKNIKNPHTQNPSHNKNTRLAINQRESMHCARRVTERGLGVDYAKSARPWQVMVL